jgi:hypothetical protein
MLQIRSAFWRSTLLSGFAFFFVSFAALGLGSYLFHDAFEMRQMLNDVWDHGVEAKDSEVSGEVSSNRFIFDTYKLRVQYTDVTGAKHDVPLEYTSVIQGIHEKEEPVVKYDAAHFERVSVSWLHELSWGPWIWMLLALAFVFGGLWGIYKSITFTKQTIDRTRAVAAEYRPLSAECLSVKQVEVNGRPTPHHEVEFLLTAGANKCTTRITSGQPLHTDKKVLVLVARNDTNWVVPRAGDFYPFEMSAPEIQQITAQFMATSAK